MSTDVTEGLPLTWPELGPRPHEFAAVFRLLVGDEKESLAADVVAKGVRERIKMFEDKILDGRNRYLVLVDEGVFDPEIETWQERPELFEVFEGTREEALEYVWSLNAERRHDTPAQRAMAAERYANLRNVTQAEAAAKFNVSERQVNSAAKVLEQGEPELIQAVEENRLPLYLAEQVADLDEDDQREVAELPKREASAVAKQKLQEPPPLAQSGPVVKALDPARFVMFAEAMSRVAERVGQVPVATVRQLSVACGIAGDAEGVTLSPSARLAVDLATRKSADWSMYGGPEAFHRRDLPLIEAAADMPDDLDALTAMYRETLVAFNAAMVAEDGKADALDVRLNALLFHANGDTTTGMAVNERPLAIENAARAPDGEVPMWGQRGLFVVEVDGVKAMVRIGRDLHLFAVDFNLPFVSASGSWSVHHAPRLPGSTMLQHAENVVRSGIAATQGKDREPHERGLAMPDCVYRFGDDGEYGDPPRAKRGVELVPGAWPAGIGIGEIVSNAQFTAWETEDRAYPKPRKRQYPKSRHGSVKVFAIGEGDVLVPVADYPATGPYLIHSWKEWRYVDEGADPDEARVASRLAGAADAPSDLVATYAALVAAAGEQQGSHTKETAEPILRAGFAATVPVRQMADDLGHKLGTVQSWTHRLDLTEASRSPLGAH